jgi:hypothetical protein
VQSLSRLLSEHGLFVEQFWLTSQPAIGRNGPSPAAGLGERVRRLGVRAFERLFEAHRQVIAGSFVLTLLARKTGSALEK